MADEKNKNEETQVEAASAAAPEEPSKETSPVAESVVLPTVAAPPGSLIGDENIPAAEPFEVDVVQEQRPAQVKGPDSVPVEVTEVHETHVVTDTVITDPSSPLAVQIPDAGRGSLDLPIHGLSRERPEDYFAREASKSTDD